jgi:hypothetical protein
VCVCVCVRVCVVVSAKTPATATTPNQQDTSTSDNTSAMMSEGVSNASFASARWLSLLPPFGEYYASCQRFFTARVLQSWNFLQSIVKRKTPNRACMALTSQKKQSECESVAVARQKGKGFIVRLFVCSFV